MQGSGAQDFLQSMYGDDDDGGSFDESSTKITAQQKVKYLLHQSLLVFFHIEIFWWLPITGNNQLFGASGPECPLQQDAITPNTNQASMCRDFEANKFLRNFYVLVCVYLYLSALQIRAGFPILKKPSSVLQYNESVPA